MCDRILQLNERCLATSKQTKQKKLHVLKRHAGINDVKFDKNNVVNLSSTFLSDDDLECLSYGLNMSLPKRNPSTVLNAKIYAEKLYSTIKPKIVTPAKNPLLRNRIQSLILNYATQRRRVDPLHRHIMKHVSNLAKNRTLHICKADKGSNVIVMDKNSYTDKMLSLLSDPDKFCKYNHASTKPVPIYLEEKFNRVLYGMKRNDAISQQFYHKCRAIGTFPARLYGQPKIHKNLENPPKCPIISSIGSTSYALSKELDKLLKPLTNTSSVKLCDTFDFIENIRQFLPNQSTNDCNLVSFDVTNLFGMVPVDEAIDIATKKLFSSRYCPEDMVPSVFKNLLQLAISNNVFLFNGVYYIQKNGVAMGNPLAPTLAELFMQELETKLDDYSGVKPSFYRRYVDDIFAIFNSVTDILMFESYLNTLHPRIKFTTERYDNGLNFLDTRVFTSPNGLETSWHRKESASDRITPYPSYCHPRYKYNAAHNMFYRIQAIASNKYIALSINNAVSLLKKNGYPEKVISATQCHNKPLPDDNPPVNFIYMPFPFMGHDPIFEKRLKHLVHQATNTPLRIAFTSSKIGSFFRNKDPIPNMLQSRVVYKYSCDCEQSYIGVTSRHLTTRVQEHSKMQSSNVYRHIHDSPTCTFGIEKFSILHRCVKPAHCYIAESLLIRENVCTLNGNLTSLQLSLW